MSRDRLPRFYAGYMKWVILPATVAYCGLCIVLAILNLTTGYQP